MSATEERLAELEAENERLRTWAGRAKQMSRELASANRVLLAVERFILNGCRGHADMLRFVREWRAGKPARVFTANDVIRAKRKP